MSMFDWRFRGKSLTYSKNNIGPKIEPWGTPDDSSCISDTTGPFLTTWNLPFNKNWNLPFNSYGHIMAVGDAYVFPGFLTPVLTQLFFPKPPTTFLTFFCRSVFLSYWIREQLLFSSCYAVFSWKRYCVWYEFGVADIHATTANEMIKF